MIISSSSGERPGRTGPIANAGPTVIRSVPPQPDNLSTENAAMLRAALARQPEIRPEVVARARALATDPDYPPLSIVRIMAQQILAAPDLSEDES
jgi:hypothetical protein